MLPSERTRLIIATVRARHRSAALTDALHEVRPVALPVESFEKTVAIPETAGRVVGERRPTVLCNHAVRKSSWLLGPMCDECRRKLSLPVVLEGVVEGPSLLRLAVATLREVHGRRETLRRRAAEILGR